MVSTLTTILFKDGFLPELWCLATHSFAARRKLLLWILFSIPVGHGFRVPSMALQWATTWWQLRFWILFTQNLKWMGRPWKMSCSTHTMETNQRGMCQTVKCWWKEQVYTSTYLGKKNSWQTKMLLWQISRSYTYGKTFIDMRTELSSGQSITVKNLEYSSFKSDSPLISGRTLHKSAKDANCSIKKAIAFVKPLLNEDGSPKESGRAKMILKLFSWIKCMHSFRVIWHGWLQWAQR